MVELTELPEGYYLVNFDTLCHNVMERYRDLLTAEELQWHAAIAGCSLGARRLYVRLLTRKGPAIPLGKIHYAEIPDPAAHLAELEARQLAETNSAGFDIESWLGSLTKAQLQALPVDTPAPASRKDAIIQQILADNEAEDLRSLLAILHPVVTPLGLRHVQCFRLLFFGNQYQDLSEFIISELGHVQYESYSLDRAQRAFSERLELDKLLDYGELNLLIDDCLRDADTPLIKTWLQQLGERNQLPRLQRRYDRIANKLARQLERLGEAELALELFTRCEAPPARERRARILNTLDRQAEALAVLDGIAEDPYCEPEFEFGEKFARRIRGVRAQAFVPAAQHITVAHLDQGPEQAALDCYRDCGWEGDYVENTLVNSLFGLAFWDIIFAPVPGVFHHSFQRGPSDLFQPEFVDNRHHLLEQRMRLVSSGDGWHDIVWQTHTEKAGLANFFVNWQWPEPALLQRALATIPAAHFAAMFRRLLRDLRHNRSGFPDLVLFRDEAYLMVEVKGPGDSLQNNQLAWLRYFEQHSLPAEVAWLKVGG